MRTLCFHQLKHLCGLMTDMSTFVWIIFRSTSSVQCFAWNYCVCVYCFVTTLQTVWNVILVSVYVCVLWRHTTVALYRICIVFNHLVYIPYSRNLSSFSTLGRILDVSDMWSWRMGKVIWFFWISSHYIGFSIQLLSLHRNKLFY